MLRTAARWLNRLLRGCSGSFALVSSLSGGLIMLAILADVIGRQLFGSSVRGMVEVSELLLVAMVFFGLAYAEKTGTHVRTTLVTDRLPHHWAQMLRALSLLIVAIMAAWFIWATGHRALLSIATGEYRMGILRAPVWPARAAITVGFGALLLEVVIKFVDGVNAVRLHYAEGRDPDEIAPPPASLETASRGI
jgi:TRAP-type C4-dicarboxylate transport system permease small subunit